MAEEFTFTYRQPDTPGDVDEIISRARAQLPEGPERDALIARLERIKARLEKGPIT